MGKLKMIKNSTYALILLFTLTVLSNCHSIKSITSKTKKPEDFDQFYDRFHKDSSFQVSRLKFPLGGQNQFGKPWTTSNWHLLKGKIYDVDKSKFKVDFKKTSTDFYQRVWLDASGFSSESRFKLIDGKWFLVYELEQNN